MPLEWKASKSWLPSLQLVVGQGDGGVLHRLQHTAVVFAPGINLAKHCSKS